MSFSLMHWALQQKTGSPTRKAVLLALADRANADTGKCCPSVELIAEQSEFSVRAVQTALSDLCKSGLISRERRKREDGWLGGYDYTFGIARSAAPAPRPAPPAQARPAADADEGEPGRQDLEPVNREAHELHPAVRSLATTKVDRVAVTLTHAQLAVGILGVWNMHTEQALSARDWLAKIVMRIREHPELDRDDHEHIIVAALAAPWWDGPATPSVVYGNGAQFERSIVTAQKGPGHGARRYGLGMTSAEILAATQGPERDEG